MKDHIREVHGFVITEANPPSEGVHMAVVPALNEVHVRLTPLGEAILDSRDQQTLGLNGQRNIVMSRDEYTLFLNKLHALLQLKGMAAHGSGEISVQPSRN
jgi:hypothetical protein